MTKSEQLSEMLEDIDHMLLALDRPEHERLQVQMIGIEEAKRPTNWISVATLAYGCAVRDPETGEKPTNDEPRPREQAMLLRRWREVA